MEEEKVLLKDAEVIQQEQIENLIYTVRGVQVMLDRDLAVLHLRMLVCARSASIQWDLI